MKAGKQENSQAQSGMLPVTVVAGPAGAGKRAVIGEIARSAGNMRAILLLTETRDMAPQHLRVITLAERAERVHDHEGETHAHACGCHSCGGEMQRALASAIFREAQSGECDHLIVDSPEQLNPATVVALFQPHPHAGHPLGEVAFVQSIISVVETQCFVDAFLRSSQQDAEESLRVLDQAECANCVILDAPRSMEIAGRVSGLVRLLNPSAEFLFFDQLSTGVKSLLVNNGLQDWIKKGGAGWQRLLEANPPSRTSGGWVFRSRTPFHPIRLSEALNGPLKSVFRIKGIFFTANRMSEVGFLERVGTRDFSGFRGTWWAATDRDQWPANPRIRASIERSLVEPFGDRQQEIVLISPDLDQEKCNRCLSASLLTREELEQGEQTWRLVDGPFPEVEYLSQMPK